VEDDAMSFDIFGWLRRRVAESVVGGVSDGMKAIVPEGEPVPADIGELRAMLAAAAAPKQLATAKDDEDETPAKRRK
jgi:hypothetical protein